MKNHNDNDIFAKNQVQFDFMKKIQNQFPTKQKHPSKTAYKSPYEHMFNAKDPYYKYTRKSKKNPYSRYNPVPKTPYPLVNDFPYCFLPVVCMPPQSAPNRRVYPAKFPHHFDNRKLPSFYTATKSKSMVNLCTSSFDNCCAYGPGPSDSKDLDFNYSLSSHFTNTSQPGPTAYYKKQFLSKSNFLIVDPEDDRYHIDDYFYNKDFSSQSTTINSQTEYDKKLKCEQYPFPQNFRKKIYQKDFATQTDFVRNVSWTQTVSHAVEKSSANTQTLLRDVNKLMLLLPGENLSCAQQLKDLKDMLEKRKNKTKDENIADPKMGGLDSDACERPRSTSPHLSHMKNRPSSPPLHATRKLKKQLYYSGKKATMSPKTSEKQ